MKYSILMSVYREDSPEYFKVALDSIYQKQTKKPDEIVIVEDGPVTEELRQVVRDFVKETKLENPDCNNLVKVIVLKKNAGLGIALREGANNCIGDYIIRMDSDDISLPERIEILDSYLSQHPEIDALGTDIGEFIEDPGKIVRHRVCPADHESIVKMSKKRNPMNHVSCAIKRSSLEKIGNYRSLSLIEDYFLWVRMIAHDMRLANINQSLVAVRIGNGFEKRRRDVDRVKSWKVLQKYMLKHKMINHFQAALNMLYIRLFVYSPACFKKLAYNKMLRRK
ncbi:MAG: glycosyltransferase [Lachnospiraceae bacterium]|nr:glycosyltransferase [Lachnospiraceae bacterium]